MGPTTLLPAADSLNPDKTMATIYFRRVKVFAGSYLSLVAVRDVREEEASGLSLDLQEYMIYCGDIAVANKLQRDFLRKTRREWRKEGHRLVYLKANEEPPPRQNA